jgi:hypothetical protein
VISLVVFVGSIYSYNYNAPLKNQSVGIHHPKFGQALKVRMDKLGVECDLQARVRPADGDELTFTFIKKHFAAHRTAAAELPKLGEKWTPADVDLARPIYESSFDDPKTLTTGGWKVASG